MPNSEPRARVRLKQTQDGFDLRLAGIVGDMWDGFDDDSVAELVDGLEGRGVVRINSPGGLVFSGMAIHSMLARLSDVTVRVEGLAASIASVIMLAGQRVEIERGAMVMIHNPWNVVMGDSQDLRKSADVLDKIKESIIDIYEAKTGQPRDVLAEMMDEETWLTADEAVEWGFADAVVSAGDGEPEDRLQNIDLSILATARHAPDRIAALIQNSASRRNTRATEPATLSNEEPTMTDPTPTPAAPSNAPENDAKAIAAEAVRAERERCSAIRKLCTERKLPNDFAERMIAGEHSVQDATERADMLAAYLKDSPADGLSGTNRIEITRDQRDTVLAGATKALLHRANPRANKIEGDDPAREYAGMRLFEMARVFAERSGADVRGRSGMEIARAALHTTSDFPSILENVISKTLRAGYDLAPRQFVAVGRQATLPDYKEKSIVQLGEAPKLQKVLEGGDYKHGTIGDAAEKYRLFKYGRILAITREVIVNDDLDAVTRIPMQMGGAAGQLESTLFWAHFTGNPTMHDGTALFHADHGNLAGAGAAISVDSLGAARAAMRQQKGLDGEHFIDVQPRFLVVPTALETKAAQFISTNLLAETSSNINPFAGSLELLSVPHLDANSATAWYLFGDPNMIDTIEYAYMAGEEGPQIETKDGFEVDGLQVKVRHDFGVKAVDWRGMYKNAGA